MAVVGLEMASRSKEARKSLMRIGFDYSQLRAAIENCFADKVGIEAIQCISQFRSQFFEDVTGEKIILDLFKRVEKDIIIDAALEALDDEQGKMCAVWIIGELGDRNILPRLEAKLSDLDVHNEINQAIQKIIQRAPEGSL